MRHHQPWLAGSLRRYTVFCPVTGSCHKKIVSLSPKDDAPSFEAMGRIGMVFKEGDPDSFAMVIIEGTNPRMTPPITTAWLGVK